MAMGINDRTKKELALNAIEDLVSDYLYYGRLQDEDLPYKDLWALIMREELRKEEIVKRFSEELDKGILDIYDTIDAKAE
jgi:hypothetical protein